MSRRLVFPQLFREFSQTFTCVSITRQKHGERVLYFFQKTPQRKEGKCKLSLSAPSLCRQLVLVLCFHRVIEPRFLTNQRAYFLELFSNQRILNGRTEMRNLSQFQCFQHEKRNSVSPSDQVIFFLLNKNVIIHNDVLGDFPKISEDSPKVVRRPDEKRTFHEKF